MLKRIALIASAKPHFTSPNKSELEKFHHDLVSQGFDYRGSVSRASGGWEHTYNRPDGAAKSYVENPNGQHIAPFTTRFSKKPKAAISVKCQECDQTFKNVDDLDDHQEKTGHANYPVGHPKHKPAKSAAEKVVIKLTSRFYKKPNYLAEDSLGHSFITPGPRGAKVFDSQELAQKRADQRGWSQDWTATVEPKISTKK